MKRIFPKAWVSTLHRVPNDFLFASIHEVVKTLIEAFILVFIVVYIFLQDMPFYVDSGDCHSGSFDCHLLCLEDYRLQYQLC